MEAVADAKWLHDGSKSTEGEVLQLIFGLVAATKPLVAIETGTYTGEGTKAISRALIQNDLGWLWTVEYDEDLYVQYMDPDEKRPDRTTFVHDDSLQFVKSIEQTVNFGFVDCGEPDHRLAVADALRQRTDGLLLMHDTRLYPGFLEQATDVLGSPRLAMDTLHGLAIWEYH